ncbi:MAG: YncE family protein [Actinobacteria bacterium]|nr:YncE family protein [Actinomycetota bacterium]
MDGDGQQHPAALQRHLRCASGCSDRRRRRRAACVRWNQHLGRQHQRGHDRPVQRRNRRHCRFTDHRRHLAAGTGVRRHDHVGRQLRPRQCPTRRRGDRHLHRGPITVGDGPRGVAFDGTSIWVANRLSDNVTRIDAATGTVIGTPVTAGDGPYGITFDGTRVWVTNELADTVTAIDAATATVIGTPIAVGDSPRSISVDGTNLWVANRGSSNVTKLRAG